MRQKKIWMPYLTIGISLLILFSCEKTTFIDYLYEVEHFYINQSGEDLTMRVFNNHDEMFKSFFIENGDSINTHTSITDGPGIFYFASNTHEVGDSVIISFDDGKCLTYLDNPNNKIFNLEEYDNYSDELIQQGRYTLYYTFTEEDYNLAVDCE